MNFRRFELFLILSVSLFFSCDFPNPEPENPNIPNTEPENPDIPNTEPEKLTGLFSINSDGDQVQFSRGNLQATYHSATSSYTFGFADNQYDYVGDDSGNTTIYWQSDGAVVDLFDWSTSSTNYGISSSTSGNFVDWGKTIGDGNTFRTLTIAEWDYLIGTATIRKNKWGLATLSIDGKSITGLILLPDSWTLPSSCSWTAGKTTNGWTTNTYTKEQWQAMENVGAVFLPACGYRRVGSSSVDRVGSEGNFWSATAYGSDKGLYYLGFDSSDLYTGGYDRVHSFGCSVRLVQQASSSHEHTFSTAWSSNSTTHYHASTCGHDFKRDTAEHAFGADGECAVCGYQKKEEKLAGLFTINSDGDQVQFSRANLQATYLSATSSYTFGFADNQYDYVYDYVGDVSGNTTIDSQSDGAVVDLFGWSTSSTNYGISASTDNSTYSGEFVDWGKTIGDGDTFRTLTIGEWRYLIGESAARNSKWSFATLSIDGKSITGLILLPDSWTLPSSCSWTAGNSNNFTTTNTYTKEQWQAMENAGAVFLPACGLRDGSRVGWGSRGNFWSATASGFGDVWNFTFDLIYHDLTMLFGGPYTGLSVRLVAPVSHEHTFSTAWSSNSTTHYHASTCGHDFKRDTAEHAFGADGECAVCGYQKREEKLAGLFSINSDGDQIQFSRGNLQATYHSTTSKYIWGFADSQYDYVGGWNADDGKGVITANNRVANQKDGDTVDLFGWSTSSTNYGINTSTSESTYSGDFKDWGETIGDGNTFRTLTRTEWDYLINSRTDASNKWSLATFSIDGKSLTGLVLLPDSWALPSSCSWTAGKANGFATNTFTKEQWSGMEEAGAVFLPSCGRRYVSSVSNVGSSGFFWSSSANGSNGAYDLYFNSDGLSTYSGYFRYNGHSVRLVAPV